MSNFSNYIDYTTQQFFSYFRSLPNQDNKTTGTSQLFCIRANVSITQPVVALKVIPQLL